MAITVAKAHLIGSILEAVGYGFYVAIFLESLKILSLRRKRFPSGARRFVTTISLFILVTVYNVLSLSRVVSAFTDTPGRPFTADKHYAIINDALTITKQAFYNATTLCSDAFFIYRVFIVWNRKVTHIALPTLLLGADIAVMIVDTASFAKAVPGENVMRNEVTRLVTVVYSVTLALNLICTIMIAFKIWSVQRSVAVLVSTSKEFYTAISVIVESAAVYSICLIALIVCSTMQSPVMFILLEPVCSRWLKNSQADSKQMSTLIV
ncbi:hypothetical protein K435DRAFT_657547 [Dendrothele bispora CBS 962.96]|uniref:Uncharacterized protein n=1 Tax=Dendrothele bispora (strain CBS 962.96) TaxID=1314807 RepID=A0A4S8MDS9_DENBC|nr:hypothetical protein K435DRAFT_657547 [Dendrothele bispora CBS 962.96]